MHSVDPWHSPYIRISPVNLHSNGAGGAEAKPEYTTWFVSPRILCALLSDWFKSHTWQYSPMIEKCELYMKRAHSPTAARELTLFGFVASDASHKHSSLSNTSSILAPPPYLNSFIFTGFTSTDGRGMIQQTYASRNFVVLTENL